MNPTQADREMIELMNRNAPQKQIFQHIAANASHSLSSELIEDFMVSLLKQNNLNAVAIVAHLAIDAKEAGEIAFSNQFWSLLASNASSMCNHSACLLVYHEVVEPMAKYTEGTKSSFYENEHVPFLLVPTTLESLAIVFAKNGNHAAIEGLWQYFKRFYSYMGNKSTYKALQILLIEAYAKRGDLDNALERFCDFAMKFRGHGLIVDSEHHDKALQKAVKTNSDRRSRIIAKESKKFERANLISGEDSSRGFDIVYNKYTLLGEKYSAIIDGDLKVADLPVFYELLDSHLRNIITRTGGPSFKEINFLIRKSHHSLGKFVIRSLCDQGKIFEAFHVLKSMIITYDYILRNPDCNYSPEYLAILRSICNDWRSSDKSISAEDKAFLQSVFNLYLKIGNDVLISSCYSIYVQALLSVDCVSQQEIIFEVSKLNTQKRVIPLLDGVAYEKAISLGVPEELIERES